MEVLVLIVAILIVYWFLKGNKKEVNAPPVEFNSEWRTILNNKIRFYKDLSTKEKGIFESRVVAFFTEIKITGVDFELDDECRLLVASSAIIPFWNLPIWNFGDLMEILVYSNRFDENFKVGKDGHILGMVGSGGHMNRVMLLSKPTLYRGFQNKTNKKHVGFHEFAHLLDKSDGEVDGVPEVLMPETMVNPWTKLVHREIQKIRQNKSDIDPYGGTSEIEFFAVISEYFHKRPKLLKRKHPDLYEILYMVYNPKKSEN